MKQIKMFCLIALSALTVTAFVGVCSAMAEPTAACDLDPGTEACPAGHLVTHLHGTTIGKGKLLTNLFTIECDVLALGDVLNELGEPLLLEGTSTFTNCGGCTVEEVGGPATSEVLRIGHETATVTGEGEVHVNCSGINCYYNGEEQEGTVIGPLLSVAPNGEIATQEQEAHRVKGLFCPSTAKIDGVATSLSAAYITA